MAAAVPLRPSLHVPRPTPRGARGGQERPRSEPRISLHSVPSVDLEASDTPASHSHQRATLLHPLGEEDPLEAVKGALRNLRCERPVEAASVCLAACVRAVGCRAAIAHLWDARERGYVVVYALGENAGLLLNARHTSEDPLLAEAFAKRIPRVVNFEGARASLARHGIVGGAWSVLVAPVMDGSAPGQTPARGAIELIDPLDGSCFDDRHVAAARYAMQKLGELLRGMVSTIGKVIAPPDDD